MGFSVKDPIRGSITGNAGTVNNHTVNSDVPANAKFTDTTYESKTAASGGTDVSLVTTGEKYTWNNKGTGTITKVQANGTDVASSGTANIPAASTGAYGVTKLSDATNSTSTALAATANAVKKAYDLANTANTGLENKLDTYNGEVEASAEGTINWHSGTLEASSYDNFDNYAQFQLYKDEINLMVNNNSDGITELSLKPSEWTNLTQRDTDNINSAGFSIKNDEVFLSTSNNDDEHSTYIQIKEANQSIYLYGNKLQVSQAPTTDLGIANKKYVDDAITALPEPMIFKGSLGTGGTITSLPTAATTNEGYTYKVITAGTYASQAAKVGDTFISDGSKWVLIPSGDEPSGTVTSVTLKATSPIAIDSTSAITTSGTRTLSHANSGVTAGTYRSVTVNATGHVTAGTNPTTLSGYGITDAKIANGVITLGSNTITPLTAHQDISGKVNIASIDITGQTTTLLSLTKALGTAGTNYARWISKTDGGSANISDKPTGSTQAGFLCEAYCNRWASATDYRYVLICWVQADTNPYIAIINYNSTAITWSRLNTNTTYSAGTGLNLSGTTINHSNSVTAGTAGTSSATSGSTLAVPYITYDAQGHITATGTHTHTVSGFSTTDTKNTAGSTDTSSKIFLIGATSQAANPQTYSDNEVYATSGVLTTKSVQVGGTAATMQYNSTDKCIEFIFA